MPLQSLTDLRSLYLKAFISNCKAAAGNFIGYGVLSYGQSPYLLNRFIIILQNLLLNPFKI